MVNMGQQAGCESAQREAILRPVCAGVSQKPSYSGVHALPLLSTPIAKYSTLSYHVIEHCHACFATARHFASCLFHFAVAFPEIRFSLPWHSHLTHAHDMRFAACHAYMPSSLTCLQCMRRFSGGAVVCDGLRRFDPLMPHRAGHIR